MASLAGTALYCSEELVAPSSLVQFGLAASSDARAGPSELASLNNRGSPHRIVSMNTTTYRTGWNQLLTVSRTGPDNKKWGRYTINRRARQPTEGACRLVFGRQTAEDAKRGEVWGANIECAFSCISKDGHPRTGRREPGREGKSPNHAYSGRAWLLNPARRSSRAVAFPASTALRGKSMIASSFK